jgi:hypothetical protein
LLIALARQMVLKLKSTASGLLWSKGAYKRVHGIGH